MILAVVQARMTSTRLPGKVMKKIIDKPMIYYLLERLKYAKGIDKIVVATTTNRTDDVLAKYVESLGVDVFRGSENDVLDRFYKTALKYNPTHIARVTGDCPLIDPQIVNKLISFYIKEKIDYAGLRPKFAEGLDFSILTFDALKTIWESAEMESEREHVTLYIRNNKKNFKFKKLKKKRDDSDYRITVDEPEDFEVVKSIFEALYEKNRYPFGFSEIKKFLDNHPEIMNKNKDIIRNEGLLISLRKDKKINKRKR